MSFNQTSANVKQLLFAFGRYYCSNKYLTNRLASSLRSYNVRKQTQLLYTFSKHVITRNPGLNVSLSLSTLIAFPVVNAWGKDNAKEHEKKILEECDKLFNEHNLDELYKILRSQPSWYDNAEVLWRAARCEYHFSKRENSDPKLIELAYQHVLKSLELNPELVPAHKWAAILLDAVSSKKGTKARIEQLLNVRSHMEKAVQYSPDDPTAHFLLGQWHYSCHQVSWVERKLAAVIFGSLPDADMEVGLKMLEKAEEIEKDFYSKNKVLIAQTLVGLNRDIAKAKTLLFEVMNKYKDSDKWDDVEAIKEAKETLKRLGEKVE